MSTDLTAMNAIMKELYVDNRKIQDMSYKLNPTLGLFTKFEKAEGKFVPIPIHWALTNKRSANIATALSATGTEKVDAFNVALVRDYAAVDIDRLTMKASRNKKGAFTQALGFAVDGAVHSITRSIAMSVCRSSTGSVGQISSGSDVSATSITLALPTDAVNFEVEEIVQLQDGDGGTLRNAGATIQITSVNRQTGVLGFAAALTDSIAAAAAGDFIVKSGDSNAKLYGLADWITTYNPTPGESFNGVDRSQDAVRLSGLKVDASLSNAPIEETLIKTAAALGQEGAAPDCVVMSFDKWQELATSLQTQVRYGSRPANGANVSFRSIVINGPRGDIDVIPDHNIPSNRSYMLQLDTWFLHSIDSAPHVINDDGQFIRNANEDSYQVRLGAYLQLATNAPGFNAVISW